MKNQRIVLISMLLIVLMISTVVADVAESQFTKTDQGITVDFKIAVYSGIQKILSMFGIMSITTIPSVPVEKESFKLSFGGAVPYECTSSVDGWFVIHPSSATVVTDTTTALYKAYIPSGTIAGGTSTFLEQTVSFYNPNYYLPAGSYKATIFFYPVLKSTPCLTQTKVFNIVKQVTTCPAEVCSAWQFVGGIQNGQLQERWCPSYGPAPNCIMSEDYESRTICNEGYYLSGKNCISSSVPQDKVTCYYCDHSTGIVNSEVIYNSLTCPSGYSNSASMTCQTTPPVTGVTCYYCKFDGTYGEEVRDACDGVFRASKEELSCTTQFQKCYYCNNQEEKYVELLNCPSGYRTSPNQVSCSNVITPPPSDIDCTNPVTEEEYCTCNPNTAFCINTNKDFFEQYKVYLPFALAFILIIIIIILWRKKK